MAMSNCRECGKAVSTKAKTCPNCGAPKPAKKLKIKKKVREKFSMAKDITPHISNAPPRSKNLIWVHCSNKKCRDYTEMYQIKTLGLGVRTCTFCKKKFKKAEMRDGRDGSYAPIMPSGGTYVHSNPAPSPVLPSGESTTYQSSSSSSNSQSEDTFEKFSAGKLDLATSFWGFLFAGSLVVGFVCGWLSAAYGKGWYIPLIGYTIFAIQGTWSSAEKYKIEQNKKKQSEVWGFLAQAVCVLNGISIIGMIAEFF